MKYAGYIYKTTNLINGKIYIGQHQSKKNDDSYFGSGKILQNALKKYGIESFMVENIHWTTSIKKPNEAEIFFIAAYDSTNPKVGYNITQGGMGSLGEKFSEETRKKLSEAKKKYYEEHPEAREKNREASKKQWADPETKKKMSEVRKKQWADPEAREKMREAQYKRWERYYAEKASKND